MKKILTIAVIILCSKISFAQINTMGSMYFQNPYLANPAFAGIEYGWEMNAAYKAQWAGADGAPMMQSITVTHGTEDKKVGIGLNFYNEKAGVISNFNAKGTYAYHLMLNRTSFLDFGLSVGILDENIDFTKVKGDGTDITLQNFNLRKLYFDGDFGIAYRNRSLTIQGSLPNLKKLFDHDMFKLNVDQYIYMAAVSYRFINDRQNFVVIEPKLVYRGIRNFKNI